MTAFSSTANTSLLTTYLIKSFIPTLESELQHQKFTKDAVIPEGMGKKGTFNTFGNPTASTTALTEGTTSDNETTITSTGTDVTIAEYGEFIITTRLMEFCAVSGSRAELRDRMAYGAALSMDTLVLTAADATTGVFYATTAATGGSTTAPATVGAFSASTVIGAAKELRDNNAKGFRGIAGHPDNHFAAIISPQAELTMITEATTGRMTWAQAVTQVPGQMGQEKWVNGYMGSVYGTACYMTQNFTTASLTATANEGYILAAAGMGSVSVIDSDPQVYVNTPSEGDVGNPYRNRSTIAWHAYFGTALLDANRVIKIYSAAS
jgi:N4-gp56 family major capsid protein